MKTLEKFFLCSSGTKRILIFLSFGPLSNCKGLEQSEIALKVSFLCRMPTIAPRQKLFLYSFEKKCHSVAIVRSVQWKMIFFDEMGSTLKRLAARADIKKRLSPNVNYQRPLQLDSELNGRN